MDHSHSTLNLENHLQKRENVSIREKVTELLQDKTKMDYCIRCHKDTDSTRTILYGFSEYLCMRIIRSDFNTGNGNSVRISQKVTPEKTLVIEKISERETERYDLIGGIIYKGPHPLAITSV